MTTPTWPTPPQQTGPGEWDPRPQTGLPPVPPPPATFAPTLPAPGRKGNRPLVIGLSALVAVLVVIIAVLASRGSGADADASAGAVDTSSDSALADYQSDTGRTTDPAPSASAYAPPVSALTTDEDEFLADLFAFTDDLDGQVSDSVLIEAGDSVCDYLGSVGGGTSAQNTAVAIGINSGLTDEQAMALVASSLVNLCPEYS
jgi:hypothetical protein